VNVIDWLLEGDPAIRWQTGSDLLNWPRSLAIEQRGRVALEGWGKRLLDLQDETGTWGGGLYSPKWTSTTYTLLLLRRFGLRTNHQAARGTELLLSGGLRQDGGIDLSRTKREPETCVTGMALALTAGFLPGDARIAAMLDYLEGNQLSDGGWNCRAESMDTHSSMHTTISVLEGILATGQSNPVSRHRAHEFLLDHGLFRSHRTGDVIHASFTRFSFPPRWHYYILRALDYLAMTGAPPDPRLEDAMALLDRKRRPDGTWPLQNVHRGRTFFELEGPGEPSRWNTLRALRVLRWWENA
jgi:hypothetical protein